MEALNAANKAMGGQGDFERVSYITARRMQEKALSEGGVERLLAQIRVMTGADLEHQGLMLNTLSGGRLGINTSMDIMANADSITERMRGQLTRVFDPNKYKERLKGMGLVRERGRLEDIALKLDPEEILKLVRATNDLKEAMGEIVITSMPSLIETFKKFSGMAESLINWLNTRLGETLDMLGAPRGE